MLSLEEIQELARSKNAKERYKAALDPRCPSEILAILAKDESLFVRQAVAVNPNTPEPSLYELMKEGQDFWFFLAKNPSTPADILLLLAGNGHSYVRKLLAENPNTPQSLLFELINQNEKNYWENLAANPNTPVDFLVFLSEQKDLSIDISLASNPKVPISILNKLSENECFLVLFGLVRNPSLPKQDRDKILVKLAQDECKHVRILVLKYSGLPEMVFSILAQDTELEIRKAVLEHPDVTEDALLLLATDSSKEICLPLLKKVLNDPFWRFLDCYNSPVYSSKNSKNFSKEFFLRLVKEASSDFIKELVARVKLPLDIIQAGLQGKNRELFRDFLDRQTAVDILKGLLEGKG